METRLLHKLRCSLSIVLLFVVMSNGVAAHANEPLRIGSKRFTESYILGEILTRTASGAGEVSVVHKPGLGNTAILFAALKAGAVDVYPEYTGTIALEILGLAEVPDLATLNQRLAEHGLVAGMALGFSNSYALAMREVDARERGIRRMSDLGAGRSLRLGLSQEFMNRKDGWPALRAAYGLTALPVRGLDHGLAYDALTRGQVDVIDVYSTDAGIIRHGLRVLADDREFFPRYEAVLLYRRDLPERHPAAWARLRELEGAIDAAQMMRLNAAVEVEGQTFAGAAATWRHTGAAAARPRSLLEVIGGPDLWRLTVEHLLLVCSAVLLSVLLGVPLGVWAQRKPRTGYWILALTGMVQTIPSLALLAFLIAALDRIGAVPAIVALFLYALLPIVRNTETAINGISRSVSDAGRALGLSARQVFTLIELPLALPGVLAGIKTATVISVGTATIAAFIGAGGYGERIVAGLAVNDHRMLLAGAVPAAALAFLLEGVFRLIEWRADPVVRNRAALRGNPA